MCDRNIVQGYITDICYSYLPWTCVTAIWHNRFVQMINILLRL